MTDQVRFKYSDNVPAFKVPVWELFDAAMVEAKDFETMFDRIFERLSELYLKQGFALEL